MQGQSRGRSRPPARPRRQRSPRPRWLLLAAPLAVVGLLVLVVALFARAAPSGSPEARGPLPDATTVATPSGSASSGPAANPLGAREPTLETGPGAVSADEEADVADGAGGSADGDADPSAPSAGPPVAQTPSELRRVRVGNSEGQGANMRREPSAASARVKVVRDGTELDLIGADRQAEGRTWRNVQDDAGAAGWILSEFLLDERVVGPRPTPTPVPPQIQVTDITSPVARGQPATLTIVTRPGLRCEVRVLLFGPAAAPRRGLEPKVADERGECSWTWTVPDETAPGTWRYAVSVGTGDTRVSRELVFNTS